MNECKNKFSCKVCKKYYASKSSLCNHTKKFHNSITSSEVIQESSDINKIINNKKTYLCRMCNKIYQSKQGRWKHEKLCKIIKEDKIKDLEQKNKELENKIIKIESKINNKSNKTTHNSINNGTINNIIINNYKEDNLEYITEKFKDILFKHLKDKDDHVKPIPLIIENIKFNPNHKENHNVKIRSDRSKIGFIYDKNKWKAMNKIDLIDDLMKYGYKIFKKFFNERKENLSDNMIDNYCDFEDAYILELKTEIKDKIENIAYIFTINNEENVLD
jgi:hypothetical protein